MAQMSSSTGTHSSSDERPTGIFEIMVIRDPQNLAPTRLQMSLGAAVGILGLMPRRTRMSKSSQASRSSWMVLQAPGWMCASSNQQTPWEASISSTRWEGYCPCLHHHKDVMGLSQCTQEQDFGAHNRWRSTVKS